MRLPSASFSGASPSPDVCRSPTVQSYATGIYDLVWSTPGSKLSADFGVSDVAIAKRCGKLGVRVGRRTFESLPLRQSRCFSSENQVSC